MIEFLEDAVAEKIKEIYRIAAELEELYPGRHYTPDGHMLGSIGEALAAHCYGLELFTASEKTHDAAAPDGSLVQIQVTQTKKVALSSEPQRLLVLQIQRDGSFTEIYNGPGKVVWGNCGKLQKNGQRAISLSKLSYLQKDIPDEDKIHRIKMIRRKNLLFRRQHKM